MSNSLSKLLSDSLTLQSLDGVRVGSSWHDDESDNRSLGTHLLQSMIQSCVPTQSQYPPFIAILGPPQSWGPTLKTVREERTEGLTGQALDEHVNTLVSKFVSTSCEHVDRVLQIEIVVTVEMTPDEIVDFLFGLDVQILKLVHGGELDDVETIGKYSIWDERIYTVNLSPIHMTKSSIITARSRTYQASA